MTFNVFLTSSNIMLIEQLMLEQFDGKDRICWSKKRGPITEILRITTAALYTIDGSFKKLYPILKKFLSKGAKALLFTEDFFFFDYLPKLEADFIVKKCELAEHSEYTMLLFDGKRTITAIPFDPFSNESFLLENDSGEVLAHTVISKSEFEDHLNSMDEDFLGYSEEEIDYHQYAWED